MESIKGACELIVKEKNLKEEVEFGNEKLREKAFEIREQNLPENIKI